MRGISNYAEIDDNGSVKKSDSDHNTQNGQNTSPARKSAEPEPPAEGENPAADIPDWAVDVN